MTMENEELDSGKILERLRIKNLSGKRHLIEDLKKRKNPRTVSLLVEMLQDESWYLREQAVLALSDAGEEAREAVVKVLEKGLWYARAAAAKVLGRVGGPAEMDVLIDCLLDSNMTVQGAAAAALVDIARNSSAAELASALSSKPHDVKQKAISCIRLLDKELADTIVDSWEREIAKPRREDPRDAETPGEK